MKAPAGFWDTDPTMLAAGEQIADILNAMPSFECCEVVLLNLLVNGARNNTVSKQELVALVANVWDGIEHHTKKGLQ